jgi:hypothetical protein
MIVFVAIPAHDGRACVETVRSLLNEQALAQGLGVEMRAAFLPGCSSITFARDQMARDFLESDADRLVFVDSDVFWEPGALLKLAHHPVDIAGGAYRFKEAREHYPVQWLDAPELWADAKTGLLEVQSVPGGFLAISRLVFEKLKTAHPERGYRHCGQSFHGYFRAPFGGGEDAEFCREWRETGGQVWLDPELKLGHVGYAVFEGRVGDWLRGPR